MPSSGVSGIITTISFANQGFRVDYQYDTGYFHFAVFVSPNVAFQVYGSLVFEWVHQVVVWKNSGRLFCYISKSLIGPTKLYRMSGLLTFSLSQQVGFSRLIRTVFLWERTVSPETLLLTVPPPRNSSLDGTSINTATKPET